MKKQSNSLMRHAVLACMLFMLALLPAAALRAQAATTSITGGTWVKSGNYMKYQQSNQQWLKSGFYKVNGYWYYFAGNGRVKTGLFKVGSFYYSGSKSSKPGVRGRLSSGRKVVSGKIYYYSAQDKANKFGRRLTGWVTAGGNRYYMNKSTGVAYTGLKVISNFTYYFNSKGILQTNKTFKVNGVTYNADEEGKCTVPVTSLKVSVSETMLFFTRFESGTDAYAQVGGDHGNACGKYQFDYRYSLLPLVKYCYSSNPSFFREFKKYAALPNSKYYTLKSNKAFYKAWVTIYNKSPKGFASYQDAYAKEAYYDVAARYLSSYGINISKRSDVVKGAVFSYAIQHGCLTAAQAVKSSGIKKTTSDKDFITKLYNYRMKKFSAYKTRYTAEKKLALSLLAS